jgi:hypothetical protein
VERFIELMRRQQVRRRSGFGIIELPAVLLVLGVILLAIAFFIYVAAGTVAWFFLILGIFLLALSITLLVLIFRPYR